MDQKTLTPLRLGAITEATHGPSFYLAASQFNEIQSAITSSMSIVTAVAVAFPYQLLVKVSFIAAFWTAVLTSISTTWQEMSTGISEWWDSKSDDTPLLDMDDDEFEYDDIIGMEITIITYSDDDLDLSSDDDLFDE